MPTLLTDEETHAKALAKISQLWPFLSEAQQSLVAQHLTLHTYHRKEHIYESGDVPTHLYFLYEGCVLIEKENCGHQHILVMIAPNDFFGYRDYFSGTNCYPTAICQEECVVAKLPFEVLEQLIGENPQVSFYFTRVLSYYLARLDMRIEVLTRQHMRGRLANTLLTWYHRFGTEEDGVTLRSRFTHEELGEMSKMTTSNVTRTLSQFVHEGLVVTKGKKIQVHDIEALKRVMEED